DELFAVVGLEQQPVAGGHFQFTRFAYVEGGGGAAGYEINFASIGTAHAQTVFDDGRDFHYLAAVKLPGLPDKPKALARLVLAGVLLLRRCPRERIKDGDSFIMLADHAVIFQRLAHLVGNGFDLGPRGRDQERRPTLLGGGQVGIGGTLIELAVVGLVAVRKDFRDGAQFEQFGEGFVGLFGGGQFDGLAEGFGLLAA